MNKITNLTELNHFCIRYISWKAIFEGAIIAIGLTALFNLLTLGLGLSVYASDDHNHLNTILAYGSLIWMLVGGYLILFVSGWISARLVDDNYHCFNKYNGYLHGFTMWCFYFILSLVLMSLVTEPASLVFFNSFQVLDFKEVSETTDAAHAMGAVTLATFFTFLVGATGSVMGAAYAIKNKKIKTS